MDPLSSRAESFWCKHFQNFVGLHQKIMLVWAALGWAGFRLGWVGLEGLLWVLGLGWLTLGWVGGRGLVWLAQLGLGFGLS